MKCVKYILILNLMLLQSCADLKGRNGKKGAMGSAGEIGESGNNGREGINGIDGLNGLSAYDIWVESGNTGDFNDFLDFLKGARGAPGVAGEDGVPGVAGEDGLSAYKQWLIDNPESSLTEFFESLKGSDGRDEIPNRIIYSEIGEGTTCAKGGIEVVIYKDENQNKTHDEGESSDKFSICNSDPEAGDVDFADLDGDLLPNLFDMCQGSSPIVVYLDSDEDGLGDWNYKKFSCENITIAGYVSNYADPDDSEFDNDGIKTGDNCEQHYNPLQTDIDGDGEGDQCDIDGKFEIVSKSPRVFKMKSFDKLWTVFPQRVSLMNAPGLCDSLRYNGKTNWRVATKKDFEDLEYYYGKSDRTEIKNAFMEASVLMTLEEGIYYPVNNKYFLNSHSSLTGLTVKTFLTSSYLSSRTADLACVSN